MPVDMFTICFLFADPSRFAQWDLLKLEIKSATIEIECVHSFQKKTCERILVRELNSLLKFECERVGSLADEITTVKSHLMRYELERSRNKRMLADKQLSRRAFTD